MGSVIPYSDMQPDALAEMLPSLSDDQFLDASQCLLANRSQLPLTTLSLIIRRASLIHAQCPRSRPQYKTPKAAGLFVVYWLTDSRHPDVPLYVGLTSNLKKRWLIHRSGCGCPIAREHLEYLQIRVVETVMGDLRDGQRAEERHIKEARQLNSHLLNRTHR